MKCTYEKTIFHSPDSGYCILSFKTDDAGVPFKARNTYPSFDKRIRFTATGYGIPQTNAINLELDGHWENNSKYGMQFAVERFTEIIPPTAAGVQGYLASGLISGVGTKTATAIVNKFGVGSLDILESQPDRLLEIPGISEKKLERIKKSYSQSRGIRDLVTFLSPYSVTANKAAKIHQAFGSRSMDVLRTKPFELCSVPGFAFKTVDAIARKVCCRPNDPMRIRGAVMYALDESRSAGHLFLLKDELMQKTHALLNEGFMTQVVYDREIERELFQAIKDGVLVSDNDAIYTPRTLADEQSVAKKVAAMLDDGETETDITDELARSQATLKLLLSKKQEAAVRMVFRHNLSIITGTPGTGKTTVLRVILDIYKRLNAKGKILLAAPTGRAGRRMAESTGYSDAKTLHSALGIVTDDEDNTFRSVRGPLDADLIIIDETSMVDMRLAAELFPRIRSGAKLLLVGDADQLPSVGPGNVFRELITSGLIPVTVLDEVFRQAEDSRIAHNASIINQNKTGLLYGPDFRFITCETEQQAAEIIMKNYMAELSANGTGSVQILSPFRSRGDASVKKLNDEIRELINPASPSTPELKAYGKVFRLGDRVLQTKNKGFISNGDVGYVKSVHAGENNDSTVTIEFSDSRLVEYDAEDLDIIELAYAMTVHKSQGSEYPTVILPIMSAFYIMLRRNLIYTAITRARSKVILVGEVKALYMAIHRNDIDKRNTLLGNRIRTEFKLLEGKK